MYVLRATGTGKTEAELWSLAGSDRVLQKALDEDLCMEAHRTGEFPHVKRHIRECFAAQPLINPNGLKKPNFLKTAKSTLPHGNRTLTHLNLENGQTIVEPADMAQVLRDKWEPV